MAIILAIMVAATMGMAMTATVFAADHAVSTTSTTHTYQIYQIFTGTYDSTSGQLQNLKYGANAKTGTTGNSVSATDMAALATIEGKTYASDQLKINDLLPFVDLTGTPVAEIGKGKDASASLAEGYYIIKDTDGSLDDPETYTLYMFKVLNEDLAITPKDGTTTVDKTVTETNDTAGTTATGKKGADYDEGDSIPYSITVTLPENFSSYKTYTATLTDTLSEGLTPPAASGITVTVKSKNGQSQNISGWYNGYPKVEGQVITFSFTTQCPAGDTDLHSYTDLNGATITLTYNAVLNDKAKVGSEGNPNEYTLEYSNNPNDTSSKENTPPEKVKVYTYELTIEKVDGNNQPLQGAGFTLYKEVTENYPDAETGSTIKGTLGTNVNGSKLADAKYYVPVSMTEAVNASTGKVTHTTDTTIDAGNYVLIETTVPAGYNPYAGENITVTSTIDPTSGALSNLTATPSSLTVGSDKGTVSGQVKNNSGAQLPSTGGIGTTIFYILGAILIIGAGIALIARRRTRADS